jgi:hypothetical protein
MYSLRFSNDIQTLGRQILYLRNNLYHFMFFPKSHLCLSDLLPALIVLNALLKVESEVNQ